MRSDFYQSILLSLLLVSFAGFDAVTLANNHLNDFGSKGVNFTVQVLQAVGIKYFGITYGIFNSSQASMKYCERMYTCSLFDLRTFCIPVATVGHVMHQARALRKRSNHI